MTDKADYMARTLPHLEKWAATYAEICKQTEALRAVVGGVEAPLPDAIWKMWEAYTQTVSELIGDSDEWLPWYCYDCEMGRSAKEVHRKWSGQKVKIKNLKQLSALLWELQP